MKNKIILASLTLATLFIFSCNNEGNKDTVSTEKTTTSDTLAQYTCPMHPEITSNQPAQCSECGMDLEKETK